MADDSTKLLHRHDVHSAELAHRPVDEHLQVGELAHIGFDTDRLIAELADLLLERLGASGWQT